MQKGAKLHRKLQGEGGPGYESEVALSVSLSCEGFRLLLEGRADGILTEGESVLIDEINARLAAGDAPVDAVLSAGVTRLRPLGLAAATTVLGMIPLVADPFYAAMSVTVMCGLAFATLLTLVVIPVFYALFFRLPKPAA